MTTSARGAYTRGQRPARPGDLTAKIAARNQKLAEAAKGPVDADAIRREAYAAAVDATWDRAYDSGYAAAVEDFQSAGIDTDAVLALADNTEDE